MEARLYDKYVTEVVPALQQKFGYKNVNQIPKIDKIVINMGLGDCKDNPTALEVAVKELEAIAGQKAITTKAKKSIANFKLREGMNIGAKVTLRGERMYEFMDKLMNIALPRVRDFHGVSDKAFDGRGNYALGIREQLLFPEIEYDKVEKVRGMEMIFVTTAQSDEECKELLRLMACRSRSKEEDNHMAKTSMINKQQKEPKFSTRAYTRCRLCGRPHSVLRKYGVCRICFRELAYKGEIPGVRKASW